MAAGVQQAMSWSLRELLMLAGPQLRQIADIFCDLLHSSDSGHRVGQCGSRCQFQADRSPVPMVMKCPLPPMKSLKRHQVCRCSVPSCDKENWRCSWLKPNDFTSLSKPVKTGIYGFYTTSGKTQKSSETMHNRTLHFIDLQSTMSEHISTDYCIKQPEIYPQNEIQSLTDVVHRCF